MKRIRGVKKRKKAKKVIAEIVLLLGASGSGKGYGFGQVMVGNFGACHYETGNFCRDAFAAQAQTGAYAPNEAILNDIKRAYLKHVRSHSQKRFIVDSPRNIEQAQALIEMFREIAPGCIISVVEMRVTARRSRMNLKHRLKFQRRNDDADLATVERRVVKYFGPEGVRKKVIPFLKKHVGERYYKINAMRLMKHVRHYSKTVVGPKVFPSAVATAA